MYLFFVRAFNDIDHITPIVWKMSRDNYPVAVYCINPEYDIHRDYRLNFLRSLGIKVDLIYNDFDQDLGLLHQITRSLMLRSFAAKRSLDREVRSQSTVLSRIPLQLARAGGKLLYKLAMKIFYKQDWAKGILEHSGAQALCFDHIRPKQNVVELLLRAANDKSIPTLALPHGVFIYTNNLVKVGSTEERRYDKFNRFDYIITQNELRKEVLARAGVNKEKISVLGSARYCDEWMTQNRTILPRTMQANTERKDLLRAVFMTTRFVYRIDVERMLKTFHLLSKLGKIEVVVKPHTRTGKEAQFYENLPLPSVADVSSVELCEWADVVLVIGSSIIIEPLKQGKPALYLKYLHENTTQYEELGACWTIHGETELEDALLSLQKNQRNVPYTDENVNRFLSEIMYGGRRQRDVLKDYEEYIVNCAVNCN